MELQKTGLILSLCRISSRFLEFKKIVANSIEHSIGSCRMAPKSPSTEHYSSPRNTILVLQTVLRSASPSTKVQKFPLFSLFFQRHFRVPSFLSPSPISRSSRAFPSRASTSSSRSPISPSLSLVLYLPRFPCFHETTGKAGTGSRESGREPAPAPSSSSFPRAIPAGATPAGCASTSCVTPGRFSKD